MRPSAAIPLEIEFNSEIMHSNYLLIGSPISLSTFLKDINFLSSVYTFY